MSNGMTLTILLIAVLVIPALRAFLWLSGDKNGKRRVRFPHIRFPQDKE